MKKAGPIPFRLPFFFSLLKRPYASLRLSFLPRMHSARSRHPRLLCSQNRSQCRRSIPPQAIAVAQTVLTLRLSSAASAKTSLRLGSHVGTFAASASGRTSVNNAPFFMPGSSGSRQPSRLLRNSSRGSGRNSIDGRSVLDSLQVSTVFGSSLAVLVGGVARRRSSRIPYRTGRPGGPSLVQRPQMRRIG